MTDIDDTILKTLRRIEDNQASMERDMEKDRQDLQNITIRLETVEAELRQVRKSFNLNAERNRDKVAEATEPLIQSVDKLSASIRKHKKVMIPDTRSWWNKVIDKWN